MNLETEESKKEGADSQFGKLMEAIGDNNFFQKRHTIIFNFFGVMFISMTYMNLIIVMSVPKHHCHVPGRNESMFSLAEWQTLKIPKENDSGEEVFSSCKVYAEGNNTIDCATGWDYDHTWFIETLPSANDWVCDQELNIATTYTTWFMGEIISVLVFGQLGDLIGRKPVYFMAVALLVISRFVMVVASHIYYVFLAATVLGGLSFVGVFQTPLVVALEISGENSQSRLAFFQCCAYALGQCLLPLLAWALGDWRHIMLATAVPSTAAFLFFTLMPESPSWLASRGKVEEAVIVLEKIAKANERKLPDDVLITLEKIANKKETMYGIASLFSSFHIARNTIMLLACWAVTALSAFSILLNISNMAGNPYLNFLIQALTDVPGYAMGQLLSVKVGRRLPLTFCFIGILPFTATAVLTSGYYAWLTTASVSLAKLLISTSQYIVWLMTIEIYPTCIRATGSSIGLLTGTAAGLLVPYVIYLGTSVDSRLPYVVIFIISILGAIAAFILPDTFNVKLPETLEEAKVFGRDQPWWFSKKSVKETEKVIYP